MKKTARCDPAQPELSIGIIFRDNIRSLERCLQSLEPLRKALPCQLVMADTGSMDGSRAVAEKYADILFDFPWIDDFSAARNAVMDRCTGCWYLGVDSDEYLDPDITELSIFLRSSVSQREEAKVASVIIRNYSTYEMDGPYSDFYAVRLVRISAGFRYDGKIHERLVCGDAPLIFLTQTVFHHDGYVGLNTEAGKEKRERNLAALREELKQDGNLMTRLQLIESGITEPDIGEQLRAAVACVRNKEALWDCFGAPILRYAVKLGDQMHLPELDEWIQMAEEWFPDSYFTRIDVNYIALMSYHTREDYKACVHVGERCLEAYADYRAGRGSLTEQMNSTLAYPSPQAEQNVRVVTANAYLQENRPEQGLRLLEGLDFSILTPGQLEDLLKLLRLTYSVSDLDTAPLVRRAWDAISVPEDKGRNVEERRAAFIQEASKAFRLEVREEETRRTGFMRYSSGVFVPLTGLCELGTAAAILETEDPEEIARLLDTVKVWRQLPVMALSHALSLGVSFPPMGKELKLEEMDGLAKRLSEDEETLLALIQNAGIPDGLPALCWTRSMVFAAMRIHAWMGGAADLSLVRAFAEVERAFLPVCYSQEALLPENLFLLPRTHRLGWYCDKAFASLDRGDEAGYIRYLHGGLDTYEGMREMIESLLADFQRRRKATASPELLALAEQVRTVLAAYDSKDPAVEALKASEAYQKVAYLLEEGT